MQKTRERIALTLKRKTNLKTGTVIEADSIVDESSGGILVKNSDCIKFIPLSDLKIEELADDGVYSKSEAILSLISREILFRLTHIPKKQNISSV